jgi:D-2-hydroxyacid dehydrogenase (NADP+)
MTTGIIVSKRFVERYGDDMRRAAAEGGLELELLCLPTDPDARMGTDECNRAEMALFSYDIFPDYSRSFFAAAQAAENLRWLHTFSAGTDHPVFQRLLQRGVRMTNSAGSTAEPIAQTLITGLLMLARNFPFWLEHQRKREWVPMQRDESPDDLRGQTMVVLGLGSIGKHTARLGQALGLHVIGVRRSPAAPGDPVDEMATPQQFLDLLPRADWLAVTAPLTDETRGIVSGEAISRLPRGARVLNVGRGEIIDEGALIEALRSGQVGGAYLDVFRQEPLPAESPLWDMPNVIITPHNSAASTGNDARGAAIFLENLTRWGLGETMRNEVWA